jgi:hypothetical protein
MDEACLNFRRYLALAITPPAILAIIAALS